MLGLGKVAGGMLGAVLDKFFGGGKDSGEIAKGQNRANEAEISGAPASRLRLWRSFLGWVLALVFAWEVVGRGIVTTYWPGAVLPPSSLEEVSAILLGMLGLGI